MDRGAWWAAVHGVTKSQTRLSDFTFTFHFHALEKEMATHSSVLAWRIPGTGEPGGLRSMVSHRVGHDRSDLAAAVPFPNLMDSTVGPHLKPLFRPPSPPDSASCFLSTLNHFKSSTSSHLPGFCTSLFFIAHAVPCFSNVLLYHLCRMNLFQEAAEMLLLLKPTLIPPGQKVISSAAWASTLLILHWSIAS